MMKKCQNFSTGNSGDLNFFQLLLQIFLKFAVCWVEKWVSFSIFKANIADIILKDSRPLPSCKNTCQMEKLVVDSMVTHKFKKNSRQRYFFCLWKNRTDSILSSYLTSFCGMKNDDDVSNQLSYLQCFYDCCHALVTWVGKNYQLG